MEHATRASGGTRRVAARCSSIEIAFTRAKSAPFRLQRDGSDATLNEAVSKVVETCKCGLAIATWTRPEDLHRGKETSDMTWIALHDKVTHLS
jgi:hypothetical protein